MKQENATVTITANGASRSFFTELWEYRYVLIMLAWRDILVRYRQTILGIAWALLTPILTAVVLSAVFSKFAQLSFDSNTPYVLNVLAGVLAWNFFSSAISRTSLCFVGNQDLIKKVYFPRVYLPLSSLSVDVADSLIGTLAVLIMAVLVFSIDLSFKIILLPLFLSFNFLAALGPGLIIASLNVKFRDIKYALPFVLQLLFFASPVGYPVDIVPESYRMLYELNPLVGLLELYRWAIIPDAAGPSTFALFVSITFVCISVPVANYTLRKLEKRFADSI